MNNSERPGATNLQDNLVYQSGLWKKTAKSGMVYLSGKIGDYWVSVFRSKHRENNPKAPHSNILLTPKSNEKGDREGQLSFGVWEKVGKRSGKEYLGGKHDNLMYHIYPNLQRKNENAPDYNLRVYDLSYRERIIHDNTSGPLDSKNQGVPDFEKDEEFKKDKITVAEGEYLKDPEDPWEEDNGELF